MIIVSLDQNTTGKHATCQHADCCSFLFVVLSGGVSNLWVMHLQEEAFVALEYRDEF